MQICHADNKFKPFILKSVIDSWRTAGHENVSISVGKVHETGPLLSFISEISEEVCSQLHSGIMKTARRVVLDEIISHVIAECVASKKANKNQKLEVINQTVKTNMVMDSCPIEIMIL